jgi:hypothetical protein
MFNLEYVKNPVWVHTTETQFDCLVKFTDFEQELPFGCGINDPLPHVQEIWRRTLSGEFGPIAPYAGPPEPTYDDLTQSQPNTTGSQDL